MTDATPIMGYGCAGRIREAGMEGHDMEYTIAQEGLNRWRAAYKLVQYQVNDDGLWFITDDVTIAYLQQELRRLHAIIEGNALVEVSSD